MEEQYNIILPTIKDIPEAERSANRKKDEELFVIRSIAEEIEGILREYLDLREDYYKLIVVWIVGCYLHDNFSTYPYLFFNAMRGSGKSRALKLITALGDGEMLISLKEAVLFRYPKNKLLVIDEFEGVNNKENSGLREILNASYKKGMGVMRAKRVKLPTGDDYVLEKHEPFKPIAMANIWGMEEVLGDRAITLILEKSANFNFSMMIEDFDENPRVNDVKVRINAILMQLRSYCYVKEYIALWNKWVKTTYGGTYTQTTLTTHNTSTTLTEIEPKNVKDLEQELFFESIARTGINGRNLELFLPLILVAKTLGEEWMIHILKLAETMLKERKIEEMTQSKDVSVYDFVSRQIGDGWCSIKQLTSQFREFISVDGDEDTWVNNKWLGRALMRLNLVKEKRRLNKGIEVIMDSEKAREKLKIFQTKSVVNT